MIRTAQPPLNSTLQSYGARPVTPRTNSVRQPCQSWQLEIGSISTTWVATLWVWPQLSMDLVFQSDSTMSLRATGIAYSSVSVCVTGNWYIAIYTCSETAHQTLETWCCVYNHRSVKCDVGV